MKLTTLLVLPFVLVPSFGSRSNAQSSNSSTPAPIPPQIASAQKVFISNAGGESAETVMHGSPFNGGPDRAYNEFYAAVKKAGHYEFVSSPGDADLVFEIGWEFTPVDLKEWQQFNPVDVLPPVIGQLRLVVIDPKTRIVLWTISEYIRGAALLGNRDKNFDQAMTAVVNRLEHLAQPVANAPEPGGK